MSDFDKVLFGKKTFASLLKDVYDNSVKTEKQIAELITSLKPFIKTAGDAVMIVPLICDYLDVKVKNDEHLVKMASVVQRAIAAKGKDTGDDLGLTEDEKKQLLIEINAIGTEQVQLENKVTKMLPKKNEN